MYQKNKSRKRGVMTKITSEETIKILAQVAEQSAAGIPWLDGRAESKVNS